MYGTRSRVRKAENLQEKQGDESEDLTGQEGSIDLSPMMVNAWKAWLDQGSAVRATFRYFSEVFDEFDAFLDTIIDVSFIYFIGQGDSLFIGDAAVFLTRYLEGCPAQAMSAYEFYYHPPPLSSTTIVFAISASGEVLSTLDAARLAIEYAAPVIGITTNAGSSLANVCNIFLTPVLNIHSPIPLNSTTASMALVFIATLFILRSFKEEFPPILKKNTILSKKTCIKCPR